MSKQNEDQDLTKSLSGLFEEELGKSDDAVVLHCPHCEEGISKADVIAKAKRMKPNSPLFSMTKPGARAAAAAATKPKKVPQATSEASGYNPSQRYRSSTTKSANGLPGRAEKESESEEQNSASGSGANARFGNAPKPHVATKKAGKKVPKTSPAYPGAMAAKKSDAVDDDESTSTEDDTSEEGTTDGAVSKSVTRPTIVGTAHVQYYTDPSPAGDAAIAKLIAEGGIGQQPTQPIDKNHKRTW